MTRSLCVVLVTLIASVGAQAQDLGQGWRGEAGEWSWSREIVAFLLQKGPEGDAAAVNDGFAPDARVWRCVVQPSLGATACGVAFSDPARPQSGFALRLGTHETGGFSLLSTASGETLWEDKWCPWEAYNAYILEGVVEDGRVRAQMLLADRKTLVSQSPWLEVTAEETGRLGRMTLFTRSSRARFWGWEASDEPLSPITDDAPNKRRLAQGDEGDWTVVGAGNWMWVTAQKQRVRQYSNIERTWALSRTIHGKGRLWRTAVRVYPPAGGAGMLLKSDGSEENGLLVWLGGTYGSGCLMLYRRPGNALWASPQDKWHYEEDLILEAETAGAKVRARLLAGDGTTVIAESPWIDMTPEEAERDGFMGFHTWKGSAEFWGFGEGAEAATTAVGATESALGAGWLATADGTWEWANDGHTVLRQTSSVEEAACIGTEITGARGIWRCQVTVPEGTAGAGLLFQVAPDRNQGFLALLQPGRVALTDLSRAEKPLWEAEYDWKAGETYTLVGDVTTDRVSMRLLSADGKTALAEGPQVYVTDTNNAREGHVGFLTRGGPAEFAGWAFTREG